jgi:hypothetical protein
MVTIGKPGDQEKPDIEITKPEENGIYYKNTKIGTFPFITILIGDLDIIVEAADIGSGINRIEFFINGQPKETVTAEPYMYKFTEKPGTYTLTATAYDNAGNHATDKITVWKIV